MRHESAVLRVVMTDVSQVERISHALIQMQEEDREAVVERVARGVDDLRLRE